MKLQTWLGAALGVLLTVGVATSGEPACCPPPPACHAKPNFLQRLYPYGGGLVRWWKCHCFPSSGAPDDYCRKPLPRVCWPPYPPYYTCGQAEIGSPRQEHSPLEEILPSPRGQAPSEARAAAR